MSCGEKNKRFKTLSGRTGVGKSTIATMMGCMSKTCDGAESCTKDAMVCERHNIIDTVGLDDDGDEYIVKYNGENIVMSGFTFPVYNFFDKLEELKVTDVEFYLVFDANNLKEGNSGKLFRKFVETDLKCSITKVLNKYRADYQPHVDLKHRLGFEVTVAEGATSAVLDGPNCEFALHPDWRQKIFAEDLATIRSKINVTNCNALAERRIQFVKVMNSIPDKLDDRDCSDKEQIGTIGGGGFSFNLGGLFTYNSQRAATPVYKFVLNVDCDKRRSDRNAEIIRENDALREQKKSFVNLIADIDKGLADCDALPTWKRPEL